MNITRQTHDDEFYLEEQIAEASDIALQMSKLTKRAKTTEAKKATENAERTMRQLSTHFESLKTK